MSFYNGQWLHDFLEKDCHIMILELCFCLEVTDFSLSSVRQIVHHVFDFRKLLSRWVLRLLMYKDVNNRMGSSLLFLSAYEWECVGLIRWIITEDETYIHYYTPASMQQSMAWCEPRGPAPNSTLILWIWHWVFFSLSLTKDITRWMPVHHWCAGRKCVNLFFYQQLPEFFIAGMHSFIKDYSKCLVLEIMLKNGYPCVQIFRVTDWLLLPVHTIRFFHAVKSPPNHTIFLH